MRMSKAYLFAVLFIFPLLLHAQIENWTYQYNGPIDGDDRFSCIAYGLDDNIYVAGYSETNTNDDALVVSLSAGGDTNWTYTYNNPAANHFDRIYGITFGADSNVYVTGVSVGGGTSVRDLIVISLSSATGDTNWMYRYDAGFSTYDQGHDIVNGNDGNIYVCGWTGNDYFTILSLDDTGTERWFYTFDYVPGNYDLANSLVYGNDDNIYAAGFGLGTVSDMLVVSVDTAGNYRWDYAYSGTGTNADSAFQIVYGEDNNLYIVGTSYHGGTSKDFTIVSTDTNGTERWAYHYNNDKANGIDRGLSIAYGNDGNIYAAGTSYDSTTNYDFVTLSVDTGGNERWVQRDSTYYFNSWDWRDISKAIVYGTDDNIYISGVSGSLGGDFTVMSYTPSGVQNWLYKPDFSAHDESNCIAYGNDGNVYAAGYRFITGYPIDDYDAVVISLEPPVGIAHECPHPISSCRVYATPTIFSEHIHLFFSSPSPSPVRINMHNICGQKVLDDYYSSRPSELLVCSKRISSLGSGIYFVTVTSDDTCLGRIKLIKQ